ncbi:MAG: PQQ-binding-like beta-propeller repeat protein [Candidatus Omnitrophica bacterium]|nr:PQQ-binding-like beta-propeller repeat protein [Candidatus Omnitrophota bacterium]
MRRRLLLSLLILAPLPLAALAADQPQWGELHSRNQVSKETGLTTTFNPETGENIRWSVELGTSTYTTPIIAGGRVLIGTNNENPRDPEHLGDRGILLCLDEKDGSLLWQLVIPKIAAYQDWPKVGLTSVPTVEGDRIYLITNRCEAMCLDLQGQSNGNDGPFVQEGAYMALSDEGTPVGEKDADILWVTDLIETLGVHPHDSTHGSILVQDQYLYLCTSNGVDAAHKFIPALEAPSLAALDKATGKVLAVDGENMGPRTVHCTWSSPSLGTANGQPVLCFGGGDGVVYGFRPLDPAKPPTETTILQRLWRFDCDPEAPKENVHQYKGNLKVSPSNITGMPVFVDGRVYVEAGGDLWHGKTEAWLKCIDAGRSGTVTDTALVWSYPLEKHCMSTPAVTEELVFIGDCGRHMHCVDRKTGQGCWKLDTEGEIWGSPLVADGKVTIGTLSGELWVFSAKRELEVLARIDMKSPIHATPSAANGVLYVATMNRLYAISSKSVAD